MITLGKTIPSAVHVDTQAYPRVKDKLAIISESSKNAPYLFVDEVGDLFHEDHHDEVMTTIGEILQDNPKLTIVTCSVLYRRRGDLIMPNSPFETYYPPTAKRLASGGIPTVVHGHRDSWRTTSMRYLSFSAFHGHEPEIPINSLPYERITRELIAVSLGNPYVLSTTLEQLIENMNIKDPDAASELLEDLNRERIELSGSRALFSNDQAKVFRSYGMEEVYLRLKDAYFGYGSEAMFEKFARMALLYSGANKDGLWGFDTSVMSGGIID